MLGQVGEEETILYLWQNEDTVVIGRNQNAWRECDCRLLEQEGGRLARRLSGGGAVFHDTGNLNFTFIVRRESYDVQKQLGVVLEAVRAVGIDAEFSGRNDLVVGTRKFSGNAFLLGKVAACHHGTLLISTNLDKLVRYLQVSKEKISSKGVESVRSRVVNLSELQPSLTVTALKNSLVQSFASAYPGEHVMYQVDPSKLSELADLYDRHASWEWRFGRSPEFDICYSTRFTWGEVQLCLTLRRGCIESVNLYSDAMNADLVSGIAHALKQVPLRAMSISEVLDDMAASVGDPSDSVIIDDLRKWLSAKQLT